MKVKAIVNYNDTRLNRLVTVGEEFEVTEGRGKKLLCAKVVRELKEVEPSSTAIKGGKGRKKKEA